MEFVIGCWKKPWLHSPDSHLEIRTKIWPNLWPKVLLQGTLTSRFCFNLLLKKNNIINPLMMAGTGHNLPEENKTVSVGKIFLTTLVEPGFKMFKNTGLYINKANKSRLSFWSVCFMPRLQDLQSLKFFPSSLGWFFWFPFL